LSWLLLRLRCDRPSGDEDPIILLVEDNVVSYTYTKVLPDISWKANLIPDRHLGMGNLGHTHNGIALAYYRITRFQDNLEICVIVTEAMGKPITDITDDLFCPHCAKGGGEQQFVCKTHGWAYRKRWEGGRRWASRKEQSKD